MLRGYRPSLTFSILASLACLLILTWILFSLLAFKTAERDLYAQKAEHARILLATFVNQLPDSLPAFPEGMLALDSSAAIYAGKLAEERSFERLTLLDANGKVIYTVGREGSDHFRPFSFPSRQTDEGMIMPGGGSLVRTAVVVRNGQQAGKAGLILSLADEQARLQRSRQLLLTYFTLDFILLLGLGAYILSRIVVNPVARLLAATERITGGIYGHQVNVGGTLELAQLATSFNTMSTALEQKQAEVGAHVQALEEVNRSLQQAREEAIRSEKMASVGLLAAGTAHEIGTPLASVMGYAEILLAELEQQPAQADYLRRILEGCGRIDRIVRGLLDYARPKTPAFEPVDIGQVVQETVDLLLHQGVFKNCQVEVRCDEHLPHAYLDRHQLQQVLINLLLNSNDAMPDDGRLRLDVNTSGVGAFGAAMQPPFAVTIAIEDNGCGIAPDHLRHIFDPFFTTKEPGKGTGLGLAISARIIEGFGGQIVVRSTVGRGSTFTIVLPVAEGREQAL